MAASKQLKVVLNKIVAAAIHGGWEIFHDATNDESFEKLESITLAELVDVCESVDQVTIRASKDGVSMGAFAVTIWNDGIEQIIDWVIDNPIASILDKATDPDTVDGYKDLPMSVTGEPCGRDLY